MKTKELLPVNTYKTTNRSRFKNRMPQQKATSFQRLLQLLTLSLLLTGGSVMAKTYYVSPSGSDSQPGTQSKPFRTLQHVADRMQPGDICLIRGGVYNETVRPKMSGTATAPIIFRAYEGETVTISGANPVTGWKLNQGNIYSSKWAGDLGKNNQLFFDGKMVYEARWPNRDNDDLFAVQGATIDTAGEGFIICRSLPGLTENAWNGAVIWVMAGSKWTSWTTIVTGYQATEKKLIFTMPRRDMVQFMHPKDGGIFYLSGIKDALDAPNEWYYNKAEKRIYLYAPGGTDPERTPGAFQMPYAGVRLKQTRLYTGY